MLGEPLVRGPATIEQVLLEGLDGPECAIEVAYEGSCAIDESVLDDPTDPRRGPRPLGRAVASLLVRIGDLPFTFRPARSRPRLSGPPGPRRGPGGGGGSGGQGGADGQGLDLAQRVEGRRARWTG